MRQKPLKISWKKLELKLKLNNRNQDLFKRLYGLESCKAGF